MNCENIVKAGVTPFYRAIVLEIERRRLSLGISMDECSDRAGVADRYWSKALYPNTPSGRVARWDTIQDIVDGLFPAGYDVEIRPKVGLRLDAEQLRCKIKFSAASASTDRRPMRELMRELGKKGGEARREKYKNMTKEERQRIAKKARKTRRQNRLLRAQLQQQQPQSEARS